MTWQGRAWLGTGVLVFHGAVGETDEHVHAAHQIIVTTDGGSGVTAETPNARIGPAARLAIPGGTRHRIVRDGGEIPALSVYLDVGTATGLELRTVLTSTSPERWPEVCDRFTTPWHLDHSAPFDDDRARSLVTHLGHRNADRSHLHDYVRRALDVLHSRLTGEITLARVAHQIGVSAPHLSRLWRRDLGLPFNTWLRWERLRRAARSVADGASITEAAYSSGFSDGAHASRVCRDMFGMSPMMLAAAVTLV